MDRKSKIHLTNEKIVKKFESNFELVNYAIRLAENMIKTGRDARVKSDLQNRALLILDEIHEGKDHFDEIFADEDFAPEVDGIYQKATIPDEKYRTADLLEE